MTHKQIGLVLILTGAAMFALGAVINSNKYPRCPEGSHPTQGSCDWPTKLEK